MPPGLAATFDPTGMPALSPETLCSRASPNWAECRRASTSTTVIGVSPTWWNDPTGDSLTGSGPNGKWVVEVNTTLQFRYNNMHSVFVPYIASGNEASSLLSSVDTPCHTPAAQPPLWQPHPPGPPAGRATRWRPTAHVT